MSEIKIDQLIRSGIDGDADGVLIISADTRWNSCNLNVISSIFKTIKNNVVSNASDSGEDVTSKSFF